MLEADSIAGCSVDSASPGQQFANAMHDHKARRGLQTHGCQGCSSAPSSWRQQRAPAAADVALGLRLISVSLPQSLTPNVIA